MSAAPILQFPLFADKPKKEKLSREQSFKRFHSANPQVYRTLAMRALNLQRMGFTSYGLRTLWEVTRWEMHRERMRTGVGEQFDMDNNHVPYYARMLMRDYPQLQGFFEIRERKPR